MEAIASRGYSETPWKFRGSAFYQFHLVKSEVVRTLIPKELKLVEAFGYTLGGFFLASYDDSPAGAFDELVVIAGIVWNPPTSCAWASRVLVSSQEACQHGREVVGLPSHVASFSKGRSCSTAGIVAVNQAQNAKASAFWTKKGMTSPVSSYDRHETTQVSELNNQIFSINLINTAPRKPQGWMGPSIKMSLPSFSGRTEDNTNLLKYSCQMTCRVRATPPLKVIPVQWSSERQTEKQITCVEEEACKNKDRSWLSLMVMLSKPLLTLEFNNMEMNVGAPVLLSE